MLEKLNLKIREIMLEEKCPIEELDQHSSMFALRAHGYISPEYSVQKETKKTFIVAQLLHPHLVYVTVFINDFEHQ